ncbi:hypothetical protein H072_1241 [Dactylellina haptotyla CBS 200.50]|uniref:Uncharacterized protein n=1 Tax=Dactylellina haptotyla (strain CBS 200.50) TaxID=1284197 RepID=S8AP90_DACHA|nr:hypothetical protein H072_1241 [Dactylellina haptotyla CBS 200.50]
MKTTTIVSTLVVLATTVSAAPPNIASGRQGSQKQAIIARGLPEQQSFIASDSTGKQAIIARGLPEEQTADSQSAIVARGLPFQQAPLVYDIKALSDAAAARHKPEYLALKAAAKAEEHDNPPAAHVAHAHHKCKMHKSKHVRRFDISSMLSGASSLLNPINSFMAPLTSMMAPLTSMISNNGGTGGPSAGLFPTGGAANAAAGQSPFGTPAGGAIPAVGGIPASGAPASGAPAPGSTPPWRVKRSVGAQAPLVSVQKKESTGGGESLLNYLPSYLG